MSLNILLTNQMRFMEKKGFEVLAVSSKGPEIDKIVKREGVRYFTVPFSRKISPITDFYCLLKLIFLILKKKPDMVHTHTPKAGLIGMLASKICGVKYRFHTVAGLPFMTSKGLKRKLLILIEKLTYWSSNYVLPNSESMRGVILEYKLVDTNKIKIIGFGSSNGIDLDEFNPQALKSKITNKILNKINHSKDKKYLLFVGRVVKDKGVTELVDAFINLEKRFENYTLLIVGPIENIRKEEGIPLHILDEIENNPRIMALGWSDDVKYYLDIADFLIHPSYREGFPNVLLQAGAMGCPIICSDIPGNIDMVEHKITGLLFKSEDTRDLQNKLEFAFHNRDKMIIYANNFLDIVKKKFNRETVQQELYNFYIQKLNE